MQSNWGAPSLAPAAGTRTRMPVLQAVQLTKLAWYEIRSFQPASRPPRVIPIVIQEIQIRLALERPIAAASETSS
jgi:hypothetical protein